MGQQPTGQEAGRPDGMEARRRAARSPHRAPTHPRRAPRGDGLVLSSLRLRLGAVPGGKMLLREREKGTTAATSCGPRRGARSSSVKGHLATGARLGADARVRVACNPEDAPRPAGLRSSILPSPHPHVPTKPSVVVVRDETPCLFPPAGLAARASGGARGASSTLLY